MQNNAQSEHIVLIWLILGLLLVLIISIAFIILLKLNHKKHIETQHQIQALNQDHHKKLQLSSLAIQEKERQRIGSDLHDSVINSLNILFLQSQTKQEDPKMVDHIQEAISITRRISHDLNPPLLEFATIEHLIKDLFQQWNTFYNIRLRIDTQAIIELSTEQKTHMLRIAQELMNNIHKHAQASEIDVQLRLTSKAVVFGIRDNGKGCSKQELNKGLGMQNIQLRTTLLKAVHKYKLKPQKGTSFILLIPLKQMV
ncbi:sensor histidine kinase [Myroides sp. NP-2]|uniref:sensor histidine kinase n=1 Tax=Myroides sp. NP-2 TaxID=2759945 RepID=UPI0015FC2AEF|nr:ATP-binding protein [Myroides sp. NP-2]MBB1149571.1 sensor histidine kinase [Myroides sp. NP-2]